VLYFGIMIVADVTPPAGLAGLALIIWLRQRRRIAKTTPAAAVEPTHQA
jgi:TRAP-type uncharacterized transport system fused permease subunit